MRAVAFVFVAAACGGSGKGHLPDAGTEQASLVVTPADLMVTVIDGTPVVQGYTATQVDADGTQTDVTAATTFSLADQGFGVFTGPSLSVQGTAGANDVLNIASSTGASLLYVNAAGNVGIGTTSPQRSLTVTNAGANGQLLLEDTGAASGNHYGVLGFSRGQFNFDILSDTLASTSRMVIDKNGNVGIGTTTPVDLLDVYGSSPAIRAVDNGALGASSGGFVVAAVNASPTAADQRVGSQAGGMLAEQRVEGDQLVNIDGLQLQLRRNPLDGLG